MQVDVYSLDRTLKNRIFKKDLEGLHYFNKLLAKMILTYAQKYKSMPLKETNKIFKKTINIFEDALIAYLSDKRCMSSTELLNKRLMKRKHYIYAAYLAVISSLPILKGNIPFQDILKAILAKISEIISIKTLDNINDRLHTYKQATNSLETQLKAFTSKSFQLPERYDEIGRSENSTYQLAHLTNQLVSKATKRKGPAFQLFLEDLERYKNGQASSFNQKIQGDSIMDLREFLLEANEKGVGRIWLAVDFCFLNSYWYLDMIDFKVIDQIKKAVDLIFKGCNVYDDMADLEEDLRNKIINSVVLLALEKGLCEKRDLEKDPVIFKSKLESVGAVTSALMLGDLMFVKGLEELEKANHYVSRIDVEAFKFGTYVLRLFSMRKWVLRQHNPWKVLETFSPQVSDEIMVYERYI